MEHVPEFGLPQLKSHTPLVVTCYILGQLKNLLCLCKDFSTHHGWKAGDEEQQLQIYVSFAAEPVTISSG